MLTAQIETSWVAFLAVLVFICVDDWTINVLNLYSGGLSLSNMFERVGRFWTTLIASMFGVALCGVPDVLNFFRGLVASIARPGGKATGLTCISSELASKRLQFLKELVPALARVAVLFNPEDRNKAAEYKQTQEAARSLRLTAHAFEARSATEIDRASPRRQWPNARRSSKSRS